MPCLADVTATSIVVRGATAALTRRTNFRKAFISPWHEEVSGIWLYCLALAQQQTNVAVHQTTMVITHHHTDVTSSAPNLPDFKRLLHGESSKALNALMAQERYDEPRQLWDDRPTHTMRLLDAEAQAAQLVYHHVNPVAAGLVRAPSDMPGWTFDFGLWKSGPIMVKRPRVYFDSARHPERLPLWFTPPPELYRAFDGDLDALVHHMRRLSDEAMRVLRAARKGRPVIGAASVRRIHPWSEPVTLREPGGERVPTFKIGAHGLTARTREIAACQEVSQFHDEHEEARLERLAGKETVFPYGTYLMRVQHGERVAEPHVDALVTAPGATLDEVKAELAVRAVRPRRVPSIADPVRDAFLDEASDIVEVEGMTLTEPTASASTTSASSSAPSSNRAEQAGESAQRAEQPAHSARPQRPGPIARHRLGKTTSEAERAGERGASRIVTLRDRRRGRPKRSDPPA